MAGGSFTFSITSVETARSGDAEGDVFDHKRRNDLLRSADVFPEPPSNTVGRISDVVTDQEIALMSPEQRLDLIRRLSLASWTVKTSQHRSVGRREVEIIILVISAVVLIPWIAYVAVTLPYVYVTHNWDQAWVGFDILLLLLIVATPVLGYLRRQMVMLTAFATGVLLICDAWFDWMTSNRADVGWATVSALLFELPLAVLLIMESCRLMRVVPVRWGVVAHGAHAWDVRIPLPTGGE